MTPAQRDISRKLRIFNYAKQTGNVSAACRHFGISREIYYQAKLMEWETFYNCHRPHASLKGKTPYEILLEKLQSNPTSTEGISSTGLSVTT
jgi:transposase InsO family protein